VKGRSNRRCVLCVCLGETSMQISKMIRAWEWILGLACSPCSRRMPAAPVEKPRAFAALSLTLPNVSPADRSSGMGLGLRGATILTLMMSRDWYSCWPRRSIACQNPLQKWMSGVSKSELPPSEILSNKGAQDLDPASNADGCLQTAGTVLHVAPARCVCRGGCSLGNGRAKTPGGLFHSTAGAAFTAADSSHGAKSGTNIKVGCPLIDAGNFGTQMLPQDRGQGGPTYPLPQIDVERCLCGNFHYGMSVPLHSGAVVHGPRVVQRFVRSFVT
jgi:hypothetical protein